MNRCLLSLFLFTLPFFLSGQTNESPGYIVNYAGDTLFGEINTSGAVRNSRVCSFKGSDDTDFTNYTPTDISSYRIVDGGYFVALDLPEGDQEKRFVEFLVNGEANLYYLRDNSEDQFFLESKGKIIALTNDEREYKNPEGATVRTRSNRYIGQLKYGLSDGSELGSQIEQTAYNTKSLIKLLEDYHDLVCEDEICIVYRKNTSTSLTIQFITGVFRSNLRLKETDEYISETSWFAGAGLDIPLPALSPRVSLSTGLLFSQPAFVGSIQSDYYYDVPYELQLNMSSGLIKIPLNLNYRLMDSKFIPTVSLGITNNILVNNLTEGEIIYGNGSSSPGFESSNFQLGVNAGISLGYAVTENLGLGISGYYEYRKQVVDLARLMDDHYITSLYLGLNIWYKIQ